MSEAFIVHRSTLVDHPVEKSFRWRGVYPEIEMTVNVARIQADTSIRRATYLILARKWARDIRRDIERHIVSNKGAAVLGRAVAVIASQGVVGAGSGCPNLRCLHSSKLLNSIHLRLIKGCALFTNEKHLATPRRSNSGRKYSSGSKSAKRDQAHRQRKQSSLCHGRG
jgi:hypothetical protein